MKRFRGFELDLAPNMNGDLMVWLTVSGNSEAVFPGTKAGRQALAKRFRDAAKWIESQDWQAQRRRG